MIREWLRRRWKGHLRPLNLLLLAAFALAVGVLALDGVDSLMLGPRFHGAALLMPAGCLAALFSLYSQPRSGWYRLAACGFIGVFVVLATYSMARWSIDLPQGLLMYALAMVMSSVLLGALPTLTVATVTVSLLGILAFSQHHGIITPDTAWMEEESDAVDAIPYTATLGLVALGSWLSKRDNERLLRRALCSEMALKRERDSLERKVKQRTRQLEEAQVERLLELERFAEFGRLGAGWLHDIANPLAAVSLNLEQLEVGHHSDLVNQANRSLRQLERYVQAARRQLYHSSEPHRFRPTDEIHQVVAMLADKACRANVRIRCLALSNCSLYGDAIRFNQLVANLVVNAIDAYATMPTDCQPRQVCLSLEADEDAVCLVVQDWGVGVAPEDQQQLFKAFYTTKPSPYGCGLGLALVKHIVEEDFAGAIEVDSALNSGTRLTVRLGSLLGQARQLTGSPSIPS